MDSKEYYGQQCEKIGYDTALARVTRILNKEIEDSLAKQKEMGGNEHLKGYILALRIVKSEVDNIDEN